MSQRRPFVVRLAWVLAFLAGDFNATSDSLLTARMRELVDDAWELAGHGLGATWPNGSLLAPPLRIDHIYVSHDLAVTSVATGVGSDHNPLVAEISLRRAIRNRHSATAS